MRGWRTLLAAVAVVAATVPALPAAAEESRRLTPEEMRREASAALAGGRAQLALSLAEALRARDPADFAALILAAQAERDLGDYPAATARAREAWRVAPDDPARYAAAMVRAQALSSSGQRTLAQFWLRRAVQLAPAERLRAATIRDFRYVRARSPWRTRFSFGIAPTSNLNDGSSNETATFFGLPFELSGTAQALSGTEFTAGVDTRYRLSQGPRHAAHLGAKIYARRYALSDEAKAKAPAAEASDFAFTQAELSFQHVLADASGAGTWSLAADTGRTWYGGDWLAQYVRLGAARSFPLGRVGTARLGLRGERQWRNDAAESEVDVLAVDAGLSRETAAGHRLSFSLGATDSVSDTDAFDYGSLRLGARLDLGRPVFGAELSLSASLERRDYAAYPFSADGREDLRLGASASVLFREIDYWGFSPSLELHARETRSSLDLYDSDEIGVRIGFRSAF